jgi:hypothetical protein
VTSPTRSSARSPHWIVAGLGTAACIVVFVVVVLLPVGRCLAHLSDAMFGAKP